MTVELMTRLVEAVEALGVTVSILTGAYLGFSIIWLIVKK